MVEFDKLLKVLNRLMGENGCPWDREQTLFTLQPYLLEETHELIEAIDLENPQKIVEELGDVLFTLLFIAKIGENQKYFTLAEALQCVAEKLIRRHPHVFGDQKADTAEEVLLNWEKIKKQEGKKSPISDIPPTLPALARAQKVFHKLRKVKNPLVEEKLSEGVGQKLWDLIVEAEEQGIDAESALRRVSLLYEEKFK